MNNEVAVNTKVDRALWNTVRKGAEFCDLRINKYLEEVLVNFYQDEEVQEELFEAFKNGIEIDRSKKGKKK